MNLRINHNQTNPASHSNPNKRTTGNSSNMPENSQSTPLGQSKARTNPTRCPKTKRSRLIDTARNEELSPEEFARQAQRGGVAEAVRDW